ncbi:hypothetical protein CMUS01_10327 [Colletotrichum musicola]|uniref:Uncharacterized protein n=1 Tax=Colletotrichum musicola TaxID=2175873 RepID=A0A8H6K4R8_9PEZI|nr:hypothetical protein CMUS01_10327 [Colletotrichum musicola]
MQRVACASVPGEEGELKPAWEGRTDRRRKTAGQAQGKVQGRITAAAELKDRRSGRTARMPGAADGRRPQPSCSLGAVVARLGAVSARQAPLPTGDDSHGNDQRQETKKQRPPAPVVRPKGPG